ncbi:MAG: 4-(cytidine 5'-diphospho)-2-C-methyl-D-erythritol kinase [Bacteroidota bacterium]
MITFPNCKINIGLHITGKRPDGYHNIESCFYPIPWNDALEITEAATFSFESSGLTIPGDVGSNLVVKAYRLLKQDFKLLPIKIHLLKSIPMGAGLGGGSADGAFMLKLLSDNFNLGLSVDQLETYALQLGSDCPFFIQNKPMIASGRGEVFESLRLSLSGKYILLVNPGIHISTKEAYTGVTPAVPEHSLKETLEDAPIESWKDKIANDFETSVFAIAPEIEQVKNQLYEQGALYASMTGSGSTVYGIYDYKPDKATFPNYTVKLIELT